MVMRSVIILSTLIVGCSCVSNKNKRESSSSILAVGSTAYSRKVKSFDISLEEAKKIVANRAIPPAQSPALEALKSAAPPDRRPSPSFIGTHFLIVDDYYLFSVPDKRGVSLSGYYVHGRTGVLREGNFSRPPRDYVPTDEYQKLLRN